MAINRRQFMGGLGLTLGAVSLPGLFNGAWASEEFPSLLTPEEASRMGDADFWSYMQQSFTVSPNIVNLNNGGVSPQPKVVQDAFIRYHQLCNEAPSYYMWQILDQGRTALREDMALFAGCSPEEIAFDRNTTEAMNSVIFGLDLKAGDEVVLARQDYPNVMASWLTREKRDGIVLKWISLDLPSEDEDYLVDAYVSQFTSRTRVVNLTHIINWIGQILPVRRIADEAHKRNIEVLVDGAHSFALLDFNIPDLHCDYFATSLHKWLCAPFGAGLLYVKKEKTGAIWFPDDDPLSGKITKFERLGTRSFATEMAIGSALDFHLMIGSKRKEERLRYLKNYWMEKVREIPKVHIHTSLDPRFACVIGLVSVDGLKPGDLVNRLFTEHKIHTTGMEVEKISGVRVTPHVYTLTRDLDKLVAAISKIAGTV